MQAVLDDTGPYHQQITNLPCQTMTAKRFRTNAAFVTQNYWRNNFTLPHPPGMPIVQMDKGSWPTDWVRDGQKFGKPESPVGYPGGNISGVYTPADETNQNLKPSPHTYPLAIPTIVMSVPTILSYNPYGQVGNALGMVNKQSLTYSDVTIRAGRLRFDALYVNGKKIIPGVVPGTNTTQFKIVYEFTLAPNGFYRQDVYFGAPAPGAFPTGGNDQWRTVATPAFQSVTFPNFPAG